MATAILCEGDHEENDHTKVGGIAAVRALLALTHADLPPDFPGFGDEPGHMARDQALHDRPGALAPWALAAEARAQRVRI